jgi:DNA replication protein DnaC
MSENNGLDTMLTRLCLARVRQVYPVWVEKAAQEEMSYEEFLRGLCEEELVAREENRLKRRMKQAGFPFERTIEQFDFKFRPELKRQVFLTYREDRFITEGRSLVLAGAAGLGKTHLAVSVGVKMVQRGYDVRFTTAQRWMNRCVMAEDLRAQQRELKPFLGCDLLILDELGYLPTVPQIGPILYELIATRYERKAVIITSNKSLPEWGQYLHDASLATALMDRLMHHGEVYYLQGESYRLRGKGIAAPRDEKNGNPGGGKSRGQKEETVASGGMK